MTRTSDMTTFSELRQNLRTRLNKVKKSGRPLFVTTHGEPDAVVLSPKLFDALVEQAELAESVASIERGVRDAREGRTHDLRAGLSRVARGHGVSLKK